MGTGEPSFDEAEWDTAVAAIDRASEHVSAGELEAGRALAAEAAERSHPDYAQALMVEGDALAIHDLYPEGDEADLVRPYRVTVLGRLGYLEALGGRYGDAEAHLLEALAEATQIHGAESPELAEHHNALGVCRRFAGRYGEARAAYERAAELREQAGLAQPAAHFHNLSGLATARGDFAEAERWARAAVETRRRSESEVFELATDLSGLGDALAGLGRHCEAEQAYREALALFLSTPRHEHPEVAFALHNLADALTAQGRWDEAQGVYRDAIARKRATLGPESHEVAVTLNNLAALLADTGRPERRARRRPRRWRSSGTCSMLTIPCASVARRSPARWGCDRRTR